MPAGYINMFEQILVWHYGLLEPTQPTFCPIILCLIDCWFIHVSVVLMICLLILILILNRRDRLVTSSLLFVPVGMMGPRRRMDNQESPRMLMKDEAFPQ